MPQHSLFTDGIAQRLPQPEGRHQDELSVLRGLVGFDPDHQLLGSIDQPALAIVLFLVMGVIRFLLPHQKGSKQGIGSTDIGAWHVHSVCRESNQKALERGMLSAVAPDQ